MEVELVFLIRRCGAEDFSEVYFLALIVESKSWDALFSARGATFVAYILTESLFDLLPIITIL